MFKRESSVNEATGIIVIVIGFLLGYFALSLGILLTFLKCKVGMTL